MAYPQITISQGRMVRIDFPHLFRTPASRDYEEFLGRVIGVRGIVSIEVDRNAGVARVHIDARQRRPKAVLRCLADKLAEPCAPMTRRAEDAYLVLRQQGDQVVYIRAPQSVRGFRRLVYSGFAVTFSGLAVIGVTAPLIPTTPFVILASHFALRSSPRLHQYLLRSRLFGGILEDWYRHRGMRRTRKRNVLIFMFVVFSLSFLLGDLSVTAQWTAIAVSLFSFGIVWWIPAVDDESPSPAGEIALRPACA